MFDIQYDMYDIPYTTHGIQHDMQYGMYDMQYDIEYDMHDIQYDIKYDIHYGPTRSPRGAHDGSKMA